MGKLNFITDGAVTDRALKRFNLPAPLLISQPLSPISSEVDFNICFISSLVKLFLESINDAAAETKGEDADVPLIST